MTKKFIREEWGAIGLRRIGYVEGKYDSHVAPTLDIIELFQSFEDRIEKLEKNYAAFDRLTQPIDLGSYADQLRQVTEYNKSLIEIHKTGESK